MKSTKIILNIYLINEALKASSLLNNNEVPK